ncbi:MAG TPA: MFS transporter [Methanotrichaceae archaeon]|nr:MFS transporter [Methanotrichaceae archaeon]
MNSKQAIILLILVLGTLMGALDSTIVILAFPVIAEGLNSDIATTIWVILIYLLVTAVTTTPFGRVGDLYGRSRMFNAGFAIFTVGSALCGFAPNMHWLIASRGIQAIGGSLLQSNSGAIIADIFPKNERGKAFGYNSMGWTAGAMIGIVLGGVITTFLGWEYIFFINIPIGIAAVILGVIYLKDTTRVEARIDKGGMLLLAAALSSLSFGAVNFAGEGLTNVNLALMILGVVLIPAFILYEKRAESPMVDLKAFKDRVLKYSALAALFQSLGFLSVAFLIIMYLQGVRSLSPLNASLLLTPGYVVGSFLSPFMGKLSDRYGSRVIASLGLVIMGVAVLIYLTLTQDSSLNIVLIASAISGLGSSMFFPANNAAVMSSAQAGSYGSISGLLRTLQNAGILGSFVIAISVASASIPRSVAFEIFIGTTNLTGGISREFVAGMDSALWVSLLLLIVAGVMSVIRGNEVRA